MSFSPNIICFRHCSKRTVFCKTVPKICPVCDEEILSYTLDPFLMVYPCAKATQNPASIIIRPSVGDFLNNYNAKEDLHIGIVDSKGKIVEFDRAGIVINDCDKWIDCIPLDVIPESWKSHWDLTLNNVSNDEKWNCRNYNSDSMNCFNFIIEFLNSLKYNDLQFLDKEDLCKKLILPKIQEVLRYAMIYRELKNKDFFVID